MGTIFTLIIGGVIGAVVGIFVYRNNEKKLDKIADKIDVLYDKISKKK